MSIEYAAEVFVGLPYNSLKHVERLDDDIFCGKFEMTSCYFGSPAADNVVGWPVVRTDPYSYRELDLSGVFAVVQKFKTTFGLEPKVYLSPRGT
jgi:hypothetical protein